jgi:hypothetical protein
MNTVLLWGNAWWFGDSAEPLRFADLAHAAEMLAAHWAKLEKPATVRFVYQPDDLVTVPVGCPNGNRATLAEALAEEHPALAAKGTAWSFEPILPAKPRFETLLHHETEPALFALVHALEAHGITVESVWPLATWLNALPQDLSANGAVTVCALSADRTAVYRHGADGVRRFQSWAGEKAVPELGTFLTNLFAQDPAEFVLLVPTADVTLQRLDARVHLSARAGVQALPLRDALARTVALPKKHPAQLLPPVGWFTPNRVALVASIALLAGAGATFGFYARDAVALRAQGATRAEQKQSLRADVAHLHANEIEIGRLRAALQAAKSPSFAGTLKQLAQSAPPQITLTALHLTSAGFVVHGFVAAGSPKTWGEWLARLNETPWRLQPAGAPDAAGRFVLTAQLGS